MKARPAARVRARANLGDAPRQGVDEPLADRIRVRSEAVRPADAEGRVELDDRAVDGDPERSAHRPGIRGHEVAIDPACIGREAERQRPQLGTRAELAGHEGHEASHGVAVAPDRHHMPSHGLGRDDNGPTIRRPDRQGLGVDVVALPDERPIGGHQARLIVGRPRSGPERQDVRPVGREHGEGECLDPAHEDVRHGPQQIATAARLPAFDPEVGARADQKVDERSPAQGHIVDREEALDPPRPRQARFNGRSLAGGQRGGSV
jgi:hypothetical protein